VDYEALVGAPEIATLCDLKQTHHHQYITATMSTRLLSETNGENGFTTEG
jgi:hypothetical protein